MTTMYRTGGFRELIEKIEVERETKHSVWINGRVNRKWSDYYKYHSTWSQAKNYLIEIAIVETRNCQIAFDLAKGKLVKAKKLEKEKPCK